MQKNCTFFSHAAEAEVAGYRPCKRCRPELAPGSSIMEVSSQLARATAAQINQEYLAEGSLEELAGTLGVTDRQMRKVFREEFGVSPVEYWQTRRLLLAKQLLTDSRLPVTAVAMASGFQSLRRFNVALKERYRVTPTEFRKMQRKPGANGSSELVCRLGYRAPFDWEGVLGFLAKRTIPGVEVVEDGAYFRTVRLSRQEREYVGHIEVRHDAGKGMISVRMADALAPVCAVVLERVRRLFDLHADPEAINGVLGALARGRQGLRVPGSFDGFEMAVRAILGQQVSVAGARTLAGRLVERFGVKVSTPVAGLGYLFPAPARVAAAAVSEIGKLGIIGRRAETIIALARGIQRGELRLEPGSRLEGTLKQLRKMAGIGEWTAQYIAMRALSWPDAFPHTDLGIRKALREENPKRVLEIAEKWRPWRAYAALHLWATL